MKSLMIAACLILLLWTTPSSAICGGHGLYVAPAYPAVGFGFGYRIKRGLFGAYRVRPTMFPVVTGYSAPVVAPPQPVLQWQPRTYYAPVWTYPTYQQPQQPQQQQPQGQIQQNL